MKRYYPGMLIPLEWLPTTATLLAHLTPDQRELMRQAESWAGPDKASNVSSIDESLCFRVSIYERLTRTLESATGVLPNYDQVRGEILRNRLACLIIRLFIHVRLHQVSYASGI